jgi:hypothetical protein
MCACGCFLLAAVAAVLAYCIAHHLWLPAAGVLVFAGLAGWLGSKAMRKS